MSLDIGRMLNLLFVSVLEKKHCKTPGRGLRTKRVKYALSALATPRKHSLPAQSKRREEKKA